MRTVLVERWGILRHGLRSVLAREGHSVVAAVGSAAEARAVADRGRIDVAIVGMVDDDEQAPLVADLLVQHPGARVLVLSEALDRVGVDALLAAGASGILGRLADDHEVLGALTRVAAGERVLSSEIIACMVRDLIEPGGGLHGSDEQTSPLTTREREILAHLGRGGTNRAIAAALFISEATVKSHLASAYAKLGVANRHQALVRGVELGLVTAGGR